MVVEKIHKTTINVVLNEWIKFRVNCINGKTTANDMISIFIRKCNADKNCIFDLKASEEKRKSE